MHYNEKDWTDTGGGKILIYRGEHLHKNLDVQDIKKIVLSRNVFGALWCYDYDTPTELPWYQCICDMQEYDIEKIRSKKTRYQIRHSLKSCFAKKITYEWLARNGFEVYLNATKRYFNFTPKNKDVWVNEMLLFAQIDNREAFGVFVGDALAAYATMYICGDSLRLAASFFDPAFSAHYPMYALYYSIADYYLNTKKMREINSGWPPLLHKTNAEHFVLKLGWRKAYCRLGIYLREYLLPLLFMARISRLAWENILPVHLKGPLNSILMAQKIAKQTNIK